jgi:diguanylate cyclase (GGDEF)-like protein
MPLNVHIDLPTLLLLQVVISLTESTLALVLWRTHRRYPPARDWALGAVAISAGMLLVGLRGVVPDLFSIVLANALVLGGTLQITKGLFIACERRPPWTAGLAVYAAAICGVVWFTYVERSFLARVLIFNVTFGCIEAATLVALLSDNHGPTRATRLMIAVGAALALIGVVTRSASNVVKMSDPVLAFSILVTLIIIEGLMLSAGCVLLTSHWLQAKLETIAQRDPLTGLLNRRAFKDVCDPLWARSIRYNQPLTVLMLDIDHFKQINDRLGHAAGDTVLREVADLLIRKLRAGDMVCRYGGEEFAVILPNTSETQALALAERLRSDVATLNLSGAVQQPFTISIGLAQRTSGIEHWEDVLGFADQALYQAKQAGRNQSVNFVPGASGRAPDVLNRYQLALETNALAR